MIVPIGIGIAVVVIGSGSYWVYRRLSNNKTRPAIQRGKVKPEASKEPEQTTSSTPAMAPPVAELTSLPENYKNMLLNAVWYRCENPYCNHTKFLEVHHIVAEVEGGTNALNNLIVLCSECHALADNNEIPLDVMQSWILQRENRFKESLDWPYK